ncbi:MAG TPA: GNAT family N-acetyltransferase [Gammaproteobacteria bacterium]|nr:GNAT family N-acetyltransferase [Gammaproteobacteria bacterium]
MNRAENDSSMVSRILSWQEFLSQYGTGWDDLCAASGSTGIMSTLSWRKSWYEVFCDSDKERILVVEDDVGEFVGAVFMHFRRESIRAISSNVLYLWVNSHSHRQELLTANASVLANHLVEYLVSEKNTWDLARFQGIANDSGFSKAIQEAASVIGMKAQKEREWVNNILTVTGNWEEYYRGLSTKGRQKGERLGRRLAEIEDWHCRRYSSSEMMLAMQHYYTIESQSWKAEDGEVISESAKLRVYYDSLIERLAERGQCQAYILHLGEEPIAAVIALLYQGCLSVYKTSFSEKYQKYSPGWLVYCELIRDAFQSDVAVVDLFGHTRHTKTWSKEELRFEDLILFSPSLRGRMRAGGRWLINKIRSRKA